MGSYFRDFHAPKATQQPTIGDTKFSVINLDHMGWMNCDGRLLSTLDYPLLFRVVGYNFGGSNDLFALPNMQGRVPGAVGQSVGSNWTLGDVSGEETHTLTLAEMPAHNHGTDVIDPSGTVVGNGLTGISGEHIHNYQDAYFAENTVGGVNNLLGSADTDFDNSFYWRTAAGGYSTNPSDIPTSSNGNHQHTLQTQGGSQPHNNMQPTLFIGNMFIYSGKLHNTTSKWRYALNTDIL